MKLRTRIATIAAASLFALSAASGALAADTVDQEILEGTISASLTTGTGMGDIHFSNASQTSTGLLVVQVDDARGTDAGWSVTVTVNSAGFVGISGNAVDHSIDASGFSVTGYTGAPTADPGTASDATSGGTGALASGVMAMSAAANGGTGIFTQEVNVSLTVPAQTPTGTYQAEMTVETGDAPGQQG